MPGMPECRREGTIIHYEEHGQGFPVLLFAPGGMRSAIDFWNRTPWHPIGELAASFRLIAIDQRNAGGSSAAVHGEDGWHSYCADHLALLDQLGITRCHVVGGCIGSSFALRLIETAPDRVAAAVLQNPIGLQDNRELFYGLFDQWAEGLAPREAHMDASAWRAFRERMYGGDFVFSVSRAFVRSCRTPMLILAGNDPYHPTSISRELAALAPEAELIEGWKESLPSAVQRVKGFLAAHSGLVST